MKWILYICFWQKYEASNPNIGSDDAFFVCWITVTKMKPESQIFIEGNILFTCFSVAETDPLSLMLVEWFYFCLI